MIEKIQRIGFVVGISACAYQIWTAMGVFLATDSAGSVYSEAGFDSLLPALDSTDIGTLLVTLTLIAVYVTYSIATYILYRNAERRIPDFKLLIEKSRTSAVWSWFIPFGFLFLPRRRLSELERILIANQVSSSGENSGGRISKNRNYWWFSYIGYLVISRLKNPMLDEIANPDDWADYLNSINGYAIVVALASILLITSYVFGFRYFKDLFRMESRLFGVSNLEGNS